MENLCKYFNMLEVPVLALCLTRKVYRQIIRRRNPIKVAVSSQARSQDPQNLAELSSQIRVASRIIGGYSTRLEAIEGLRNHIHSCYGCGTKYHQSMYFAARGSSSRIDRETFLKNLQLVDFLGIFRTRLSTQSKQ